MASDPDALRGVRFDESRRISAQWGFRHWPFHWKVVALGDMKMFLPLLAFAWLASTGLGCVGDTETDLAHRYGRQTKTGTSHLPGVTIQGFNYGAFQIVVGVSNGRSMFEMYSKKDHSKLTANEVAALMNANGGTHAWNVDDDPKFDGKRWQLDDFTVIAELPTSGTDLTVMTKAGQALLNSDKTPAKK
jgi:hypothetical protein